MFIFACSFLHAAFGNVFSSTSDQYCSTFFTQEDVTGVELFVPPYLSTCKSCDDSLCNVIFLPCAHNSYCHSKLISHPAILICAPGLIHICVMLYYVIFYIFKSAHYEIFRRLR